MRTIIIGNSGSGKTYMAERLAAADTKVIHLDDLFWEPGGFDKKRPPEEVNRLIVDSKTNDQWIVEGVFGELAEQYFDVATTLIWLDMPWELCRSRLESRGSESKKHLNRVQSEEGLRRLLEWASQYYYRTDKRSQRGHRSLFDLYAGEKVRLKSTYEMDHYIEDA